MSAINLKKVQEKAAELGTLEAANKALKNVASKKCRLLKQKSKDGYQQELTKILQEEQLLKEAKKLIVPKKLTVTTMTEADIEKLSYDDTIKAIKSIQSKKCNEQYNDDKSEFNKAVAIEEMLLAHKANVKPTEPNVVKKSEINDLIHHLETQQQDLDMSYILEQLKNVIK